MDDNIPADAQSLGQQSAPEQAPAKPTTPEVPGHGDEQALTELHPNYKSALRVETTLTSIPFIIGAFVLEGQAILPTATIMIPVVLIALAFIIRLPSRRFYARGVMR